MRLRAAITLHARSEDQMYRPRDYGMPLVNDPLYERTVCVDFDGVLCESTGPYARGHFGKPKEEGLKMLRQLLKEKYDPVIHTARRETDLVMNWLKQHGFRNLLVTNHKVPAIAYIDDHAIYAGDNFTSDEMMGLVRKASR